MSIKINKHTEKLKGKKEKRKGYLSKITSSFLNLREIVSPMKIDSGKYLSIHSDIILSDVIAITCTAQIQIK